MSNEDYQKLLDKARNMYLVGLLPEVVPEVERLSEDLYRYAGEGAVASYMQLEFDYGD